MSVPWFIGSNGALHSPEVARTLSYAATGGSEGIVGATSGKVSALAVPANKVQIAPGGAAILNRSPGGAYQTYIDAKSLSEQFVISSTGSGGGRTDLIVWRVEDPDFPSWPIPADPVHGPYANFAVISNVPAGTLTAKELNLGYPAIALAKVTLPASTSTITNAMITDLREILNPREDRSVQSFQPSGVTQVPTALGVWPVWHPTVDVPSWATYAQFTAFVQAAWKPAGGNIIGQLNVRLNGVLGGTTQFEMDATTGNSQHGFFASALYNVAALQGQTVALELYAYRATGLGPGTLEARATSNFLFDVQFEERRV